jgi:hypothetical protein
MSLKRSEQHGTEGWPPSPIEGKPKRKISKKAGATVGAAALVIAAGVATAKGMFDTGQNKGGTPNEQVSNNETHTPAYEAAAHREMSRSVDSLAVNLLSFADILATDPANKDLVTVEHKPNNVDKIAFRKGKLVGRNGLEVVENCSAGITVVRSDHDGDKVLDLYVACDVEKGGRMSEGEFGNKFPLGGSVSYFRSTEGMWEGGVNARTNPDKLVVRGGYKTIGELDGEGAKGDALAAIKFNNDIYHEIGNVFGYGRGAGPQTHEGIEAEFKAAVEKGDTSRPEPVITRAG